jgi:hypothetical protein
MLFWGVFFVLRRRRSFPVRRCCCFFRFASLVPVRLGFFLHLGLLPSPSRAAASCRFLRARAFFPGVCCATVSPLSVGSCPASRPTEPVAAARGAGVAFWSAAPRGCASSSEAARKIRGLSRPAVPDPASAGSGNVCGRSSASSRIVPVWCLRLCPDFPSIRHHRGARPSPRAGPMLFLSKWPTAGLLGA